MRGVGTSREGLQENSQPREAHRELAEKDNNKIIVLLKDNDNKIIILG